MDKSQFLFGAKKLKLFKWEPSGKIEQLKFTRNGILAVNIITGKANFIRMDLIHKWGNHIKGRWIKDTEMVRLGDLL